MHIHNSWNINTAEIIQLQEELLLPKNLLLWSRLWSDKNSNDQDIEKKWTTITLWDPIKELLWAAKLLERHLSLLKETSITFIRTKPLGLIAAQEQS